MCYFYQMKIQFKIQIHQLTLANLAKQALYLLQVINSYQLIE